MVYCREIEELDIQQGNEDATNYSIYRLLTDKGGVSTKIQGLQCCGKESETKQEEE